MTVIVDIECRKLFLCFNQKAMYIIDTNNVIKVAKIKIFKSDCLFYNFNANNLNIFLIIHRYWTWTVICWFPRNFKVKGILYLLLFPFFYYTFVTKYLFHVKNWLIYIEAEYNMQICLVCGAKYNYPFDKLLFDLKYTYIFML